MFWETKYKPSDEIITLLTAQSTSDPPVKAPNELLQWLKDDEDEQIRDEYTRYCALHQVHDVKQGYKWWLKPTQQKNSIYLSKMALDILSIPGIPASSETVANNFQTKF